jgi:acetyltransferase-like isoleucine patch superfamily enzyme
MDENESFQVQRPRLRDVVRRLGQITNEEFAPLQPWVGFVAFVAGLIPRFAGMRVRTAVLRAGGWQIGPDSLFFGVPHTYGSGPIQRRLVVGSRATINAGCTLELNDTIEIGELVAIGQDVMILTSSHRLGKSDRRAGGNYTAPVRIAAGAWIGARSVLLPGITVGEGAVVAAGSVVSRDVPANALVSGAPAQVTVARLPGR